MTPKPTSTPHINRFNMRISYLATYSLLSILTVAARPPPFKTFPLPEDQQAMTDPEVSTGNGQTISDVLPRNQQISIFTSFTRDISSISTGFESTIQNFTVLAPEDSGIKNLPRKPWENPGDYSAFGESAYEGQSGVDRAQDNLKKFVEAHVVPSSPWKEGEKVKTLGGREVWWEKKDGKKLIQPQSLEVLSVADKVSNGEVWVLKGVLNYAA